MSRETRKTSFFQLHGSVIILPHGEENNSAHVSSRREASILFFNIRKLKKQQELPQT
jgi:hypothetical protein